MENIFDFSLDELKGILAPSFRAKQVWRWLYINYENDFSMMINIPKVLREKLSQNFSAKNLQIERVQKSSDGTKKYLFKTRDNETFESVLLKMREKESDESGKIIASEKWTICVSSQIGCKIGCRFCKTAEGEFKRNLCAGEIVEQIVAIKRDNEIPPEKRVNVVYMGMGEPLENFDNLIKAIKIIAHIDGLSISPKRQTISTSGISPMVDALGSLDLGVNLAISLHAVNNESRNKLMPINKIYNIESIIESVRKFPINTRKRVMFEYLMIKDINDDLANARTLVRLLNGINAKVNIILFNDFEGSKFSRPSQKCANDFADFLISKGIMTTIRESKGADIDAACGQLKYRRDSSDSNTDSHDLGKDSRDSTKNSSTDS